MTTYDPTKSPFHRRAQVQYAGWKGHPATVACPECGRVFDLTDKTDAAEWAFGHDCEV